MSHNTFRKEQFDKSRLLYLFKEGETEEIFDILVAIKSYLPKDLGKEILLLSSRYESLQRSINKSTISFDDANIEQNKINDTLYGIVESLPESLTHQNQAETKGNQSRILWLLLLIPIIGLGFFLFRSNSAPANEIIIQLRNTNNQLVTAGKVTLSIEGSSTSQTLNNEGKAIFNELSDRYFKAANKIQLEFQPTDPSKIAPLDTIIQLKKEKLYTLKLPALPKVISWTGYVFDKEDEQSVIAEATVNIGALPPVRTDEKGYFSIPTSTNIQNTTIKIIHPDYSTYEKEMTLDAEKVFQFPLTKKTSNTNPNPTVSRKPAVYVNPSRFPKLARAVGNNAKIDLKRTGAKISFDFPDLIDSRTVLGKTSYYYPKGKGYLQMLINGNDCLSIKQYVIARTSEQDSKEAVEAQVKNQIIRMVESNATDIMSAIQDCLNQ